jgi:hypothetical protein
MCMRNQNIGTHFSIGMLRYWTEIPDARMPYYSIYYFASLQSYVNRITFYF